MLARTDDFRRAVHLSDARRAELLRRLDDLARARPFPGSADEGYLHSSNVRVTVHQPGGGVGRFLIAARNISSGGLWFLHCGFLHPGTRCVFVVPRGTRQEGGVMGTVASCEHLEGGLHAAGIAFDEPIDPRLLVTGPSALSVEGRETIELPNLTGRLLLLDDQQMDCELLAFHLRSTGLTLKTAPSVETALMALAGEEFDVVICDLNLKDMAGEAAMVTLRRAGYAGPIIVLTGESSPNRLKQAKRDGAFAVLEKPYKPGELVREIAAAVARSAQIKASNSRCRSEESRGPVFSSLANEPGMEGMIGRYVETVRTQAGDLEKAMARREFDEVRRICVAVKGSGSGYGFEPLSRAAETAIRSLDSTYSIAESSEQLEELIGLVSRLSVRDRAA